MGSALCICFGRRAGNRDVGLVAFILAFVVDYSSQENVFEQSGRFLKGHKKNRCAVEAELKERGPVKIRT